MLDDDDDDELDETDEDETDEDETDEGTADEEDDDDVKLDTADDDATADELTLAELETLEDDAVVVTARGIDVAVPVVRPVAAVSVSVGEREGTRAREAGRPRRASVKGSVGGHAQQRRREGQSADGGGQQGNENGSAPRALDEMEPTTGRPRVLPPCGECRRARWAAVLTGSVVTAPTKPRQLAPLQAARAQDEQTHRWSRTRPSG